MEIYQWEYKRKKINCLNIKKVCSKILFKVFSMIKEKIIVLYKFHQGKIIFKCWCQSEILINLKIFLDNTIFSRIIHSSTKWMNKEYKRKFKVKIKIIFKCCFQLTIIIKQIKLRKATKNLYQISFLKVSSLQIL